MVISLPKGTKEFLVVVVVDKLANVDDLADATSVLFDVHTRDDVVVFTDSVAETDGMGI
jgi:hypothetical protein